MQKVKSKNQKYKRAFTLIEVSIVVIIMGILSVLAIPRYFKTSEKGRLSEAITALRIIYQAEKGYYYEWANYYISNNLPDINSKLSIGIASDNFTYAITGGGGSYTATATKSNGSISINETGGWSGAGEYANPGYLPND